MFSLMCSADRLSTQESNHRQTRVPDSLLEFLRFKPGDLKAQDQQVLSQASSTFLVVASHSEVIASLDATKQTVSDISTLSLMCFAD